MSNTSELIEQLSHEAPVHKKLPTPSALSGYLLSILTIYGIGAQIFLGLRPDLTRQFTRPLFTLEIALLASLLITSAIASVLAMYPDAYQKAKFLKLPYVVFGLLLALVTFQLFMAQDARMVMPEGGHGMQCALCIASVALIPSALIFALLCKGASIRQFQAGTFAVLTASSISCLTLRLFEANDSLAHLAAWHYGPTLLFATLGAFIGKWLLKW